MRKRLNSDEVFKDEYSNPIDGSGNPVGVDSDGNYIELVTVMGTDQNGVSIEEELRLGNSPHKVEKRIGIINASFFRGEVTEIVTISLTTDGGFNLIGTGEMQFADAKAFVDCIADIQRKGNYDTFIMDSHGINKGIIDAMRDRGLPVISMQDWE